MLKDAIVKLPSHFATPSKQDDNIDDIMRVLDLVDLKPKHSPNKKKKSKEASASILANSVEEKETSNDSPIINTVSIYDQPLIVEGYNVLLLRTDNSESKNTDMTEINQSDWVNITNKSSKKTKPKSNENILLSPSQKKLSPCTEAIQKKTHQKSQHEFEKNYSVATASATQKSYAQALDPAHTTITEQSLTVHQLMTANVYSHNKLDEITRNLDSAVKEEFDSQP